MFVDSHTTMDHPCDHINEPAVTLQEPVREEASTSVSPDTQAPSLPQDTPAFQVPSHSQLTEEQNVREAASTSVSPDTQAPSLPQDTLAFQVHSHSQLTEEQKEEIMSIHTQLKSQENPVKQVTTFEFQEPRDQTDVYNAIFKETRDKAAVYNAIGGEPEDKVDVDNAIGGEPQGEPEDSKSISEEESDQEEWTPKGKSKQGRPKSNVKRKYTKRNSAKTQDSEGS